MPEARAKEEKSERRRKRGANVIYGQKLGVNKEALDEANFSYRWLNDDGGRVEDMTTQDDWDLVDDPAKIGKPDADGIGSKISKIVGRTEGGTPMRAYLARKPKPYFNEDQAEKRKAIKQTMDAIRHGAPKVDGAPALGATAYVPGGPAGISIKDELV